MSAFVCVVSPQSGPYFAERSAPHISTPTNTCGFALPPDERMRKKAYDWIFYLQARCTRRLLRHLMSTSNRSILLAAAICSLYSTRISQAKRRRSSLQEEDSSTRTRSRQTYRQAHRPRIARRRSYSAGTARLLERCSSSDSDEAKPGFALLCVASRWVEHIRTNGVDGRTDGR